MPNADDKAVHAALATVMEPDLLKDLESLKMVKSVAIDGGLVAIEIELYSPAYLNKAALETAVREAVSKVPGVGGVKVAFRRMLCDAAIGPMKGDDCRG